MKINNLLTVKVLEIMNWFLIPTVRRNYSLMTLAASSKISWLWWLCDKFIRDLRTCRTIIYIWECSMKIFCCQAMICYHTRITWIWQFSTLVCKTRMISWLHSSSTCTNPCGKVHYQLLPLYYITNISIIFGPDYLLNIWIIKV